MSPSIGESYSCLRWTGTVPPPLWAITSEKNSDEYRSWVEEERQKLLKEEEKEAEVDIKLEVEKDQPRVSDACTQNAQREEKQRVGK